MAEVQTFRRAHNWVRTPEGVRDRLYTECAGRRRMENQMIELFTERGYGEVVTPGLEYYNLFAKTGHPLPEEWLYKLTDREGRLLVLSPDLTVPLARVAATRLSGDPLPLKLCSVRSIYRCETFYSGALCELRQGGVEMIGASGLAADLELITLAADCLRIFGLVDFWLEIGHAGFFQALVASLGASSGVIAELRHLVESKNLVALGDALEPYRESAAYPILHDITHRFGGPEIVEEARKTGYGPATLDSLDALYQALQNTWFGDRVRFDLGFIGEMDYYTGIAFRVYTPGSGTAVLQGGRYDDLLGSLGRDLPACGFSVNIDALIGVG